MSTPGPLDDSTLVLSGEATLPQWRRIQLERQLPDPRFPAGISVPSIITLVCLVLIGAATIVYFARPTHRAIPRAAVESQRDLVSEVAHRLSVRAGRDHDEVTETAAGFTDHDHPGRFVAATASAHPSWASVTLWDPVAGKIVAAAGEPLPAPMLAAEATKNGSTARVGADLRGRVIHFVAAPDGRVLAVAVPVALRNLALDPNSSQTVLLVLNDITLIYSQGRPLPDGDQVLGVILRSAAAHGVHVSTGTSVTGTDGVKRVPMVTSAPVTGTNYTVTSVVYVQRTGLDRSLVGIGFGVALIVIALIGFVLSRIGFVRPIRRLLGDAIGVACGQIGGISRLSRLAEARRLGLALARFSPRDTRSHRGRRRWPVGVSAVVATMPVLLIAWSAGLLTFVHAEAVLPPQVIVDYQNHADDAAGALRDSLDTGLANLQAAAGAVAAGTGTQRALSDLIDHSKFRSAYALDAAGHLGEHAGRAPHDHGTWDATTPGVLLDPTDSTVPLVLAHTPSGDGQLVAEFEVPVLRSVLRRVHGSVHVLDRGMRTVLDTSGYIPFQREGDEAVRRAVAAAVDPTSGPAPTSNRRIVVTSLVGGAGLDLTAVPSGTSPTPTGPQVVPADAADALGWVVVVTRDATDFDLPATAQLHIAWLLMILVLTVALVAWGWQYVVFVRPLRALVGKAERAAGGDRRTHITLERFDEVGALAICLEICRQAAADGTERLAGAPRVRTGRGDYTLVIPKVRA